VPQLLKVAQLAHQHGVAQVQVGSGGVEAGFYAEGAAGLAAVLKALSQVADADNLRRPLLEQVHLFVYRRKIGGTSVLISYLSISRQLHPMEVKKRLARTITAGFHSEAAAASAGENWARMFQQKAESEDLQEVAVVFADVAGPRGELHIPKLLVRLD